MVFQLAVTPVAVTLRGLNTRAASLASYLISFEDGNISLCGTRPKSRGYTFGSKGAGFGAPPRLFELLWCLSQARLGRYDPTARADDTCRYRSAGHGSGTSGSCVILKISLKGVLVVSNVSPGSNSMTWCFLLERRPWGESDLRSSNPDPRSPVTAL